MRSATAFLALIPFVLAAHAAEPPAGPASPPAAADPWNVSGDPVPFEETCFRRFPADLPDWTPAEAARWLEPVEGFPLTLTASPDDNVAGTVLDGLARLRAPWPRDAVLRLMLDAKAELKIHFWSGESGVCFRRYYQGSTGVRPWAAYRLGCHPATPWVLDGQRHQVVDPDLCLVATDSDRNRRSDSGVYEIRHQDGNLVLSQGDLRLLTVPSAGSPENVYLEGHGASVGRIDLLRGGPIREERLPEREIVVNGRRPAELGWVVDLPENAQFARLADGGVRLHARGSDAPALASVPLVRPDLYEIVLWIEAPREGTGVYLADSSGAVLGAAGFVRDARTGRRVLYHDHPDAAPVALDADIDRQPVPYVAGRAWLRLVLAGGQLRFWLSGDGVHWGEAHRPCSARGPVERVGLYCKAGGNGRAITLHRLFVRRLDGLGALAPRPLFEEALALGLPPDGRGDVGAWEQWVWENQPAEASALAWRRAATLALLLLSEDQGLIDSVLDGLVHEVVGRPGDHESKRRMFDDLVLLCNMDTAADVARVENWISAFARALLDAGDLEALAEWRHAGRQWPRMSRHGSLNVLDGRLLEETLLTEVGLGRFEAAERLAAELRFWHEPPTRSREWSYRRRPLLRHVDWAESLAGSRLRGAALGDQPGRDSRWRHPIEVEVNKSAHNTLIEIQAALTEREWRWACHALESSTAPPDSLVPDGVDSRRFTTFAAVLGETMERTPRFLEAMREAVGAAELVRLRQARALGDAKRVQDATVQYYGTPAAAEAAMWLGDRRLACGEFAFALKFYELAMPMAGPEDRGPLAARRRLAAAMLGQAWGETVAEPVRFGEAEVAPSEFERLVAEMLAAHRSAGKVGDDGSTKTAGGIPEPALLSQRTLETLDGAAGADASSVPDSSQQVDWSGRQHAMRLAGRLLLVSNRFQVRAYDVDSGKRKWSYDLGARQGNAHAWPLTPMPPQVVGDRVFVRMIDAEGNPKLFCLDLGTGRLAWVDPSPDAVASDPMFTHDRVLALSVLRVPDAPLSQIVLTSFHPQTGSVLDAAPLVTVSQEWHDRRVCQAALVEDRIVAVIDGVVLCCDTAGQIQWIRRHPRLPAALDSQPGNRHVQPPLVAGDCLLVMQPGAATVECLELASGRLRWQLPLPRGRRLLGVAEDVLVVADADGLRGVRLSSGSPAWMGREPDLLEGAVMGSDGRLLYVRHADDDEAPFATLQWRDGRTGRLLGRQALWNAKTNHPRIGPLTSDGRRVWYLRASADAEGRVPPHRELIEAIPKGPPLPQAEEPLDSWNPDVARHLRLGAEIALPGWTLLSGAADPKTGLLPELADRTDVLATRAAAQPTVFVRQVRVPDRGKPRLAIELAHDPAGQSRIEVRASGIPIWQHFTAPAVAGNPGASPAPAWARHTIDLSPCKGQQVWLTVVQEARGEGGATAFWRRVELEEAAD